MKKFDLQLFADEQGATATTDITDTAAQTQAVKNNQTQVSDQTAAADPAVELTASQKDLQQIQAAITALETSGCDLVKDEISALKAKAQAIEDKIKLETEEIVEEVKIIEQTFIQKYGVAAAHGVEIFFLAAIFAKLCGVI